MQTDLWVMERLLKKLDDIQTHSDVHRLHVMVDRLATQLATAGMGIEGLQKTKLDAQFLDTLTEQVQPRCARHAASFHARLAPCRVARTAAGTAGGAASAVAQACGYCTVAATCACGGGSRSRCGVPWRQLLSHLARCLVQVEEAVQYADLLQQSVTTEVGELNSKWAEKYRTMDAKLSMMEVTVRDAIMHASPVHASRRTPSPGKQLRKRLPARLRTHESGSDTDGSTTSRASKRRGGAPRSEKPPPGRLMRSISATSVRSSSSGPHAELEATTATLFPPELPRSQGAVGHTGSTSAVGRDGEGLSEAEGAPERDSDTDGLLRGWGEGAHAVRGLEAAKPTVDSVPRSKSVQPVLRQEGRVDREAPGMERSTHQAGGLKRKAAAAGEAAALILPAGAPPAVVTAQALCRRVREDCETAQRGTKALMFEQYRALQEHIRSIENQVRALPVARLQCSGRLSGAAASWCHTRFSDTMSDGGASGQHLSRSLLGTKRTIARCLSTT